ncbi:MAG: RHS repeat protein, partial [Sphingorhabdus sp.]|uniref:hypothetical protein n=1 Tax=Sphingorhabdus sp. TaxID=1902408 RepID=UPI0025FAB701
MVAILTGNGLGLERSSANALGGRGLIGSTGQGRAGEHVFVNATNGNLIINNRDEFLIGRGPDSAINRTYNSQGQFADDNGDNWANFHTRVVDYVGGWMAAGSYLDRLDWDGGRTRYFFDASKNLFVSKEGSGAHDVIGFNGSWYWQDGDSGIIETYGAAQDNRIVSRTDRDGNSITYSYTGDKVSRITTADGNYTDFVWSGNNLTELRTTYTDTQTGLNKTLTRTRYVYSGNRLASVINDLSPEDNIITDGRVYTTNYTYDGNGRALTISQTDGTLLSFAYDGQGRVISSTEAVEAGVSRTTTFAYGAGYTNVTDPQGNVTSLYYNGTGQLTQVAEPPAVAGGPQRVTDFVYHGNGDLSYTSTYEGSYFARTYYRYDNNGNIFDIYTTLPGQGYTVTRYYYGSKNELLTSTSYTGIDTDGHGGMEPSGDMTTRYIYDSETHLRFVASPEGRVTEYRYDAAGNRVSEIQYLVHNVGTVGLAESFTWSEQDYINWLATIGDKSTTSRTDTTYDFRGNISMVTGYARTDAAGNGILDDGASRTLYIYNQFGSLLSKRNITGAAASSYTNLSEFSYYDVSSTAAAAINGKPANQYIVQTAGGWTAVYNGMAAATENETITSSFTVMGTGTNPALTLGIYGYASGWGTNEVSVARIVSGPGQIVQEVGGLWNVTGLSNSVATRIEVTRIYRQSEGVGVYLYVDRPNGARLGQGVILSDPVVSRAATITETYAYDGMGRTIRYTDAKGVGTWTSYIDSQNRTVTTLASGLTTTSVYNRAGELVASTEARGGVASVNLAPALGSWATFALSSTEAGLVGGAPARLFTLQAPQAGDSQHLRTSVFSASAGETMTASVSLRATTSISSAGLGILGHLTGWGSANISSARVVSGPGTISQYTGGVWEVIGLSTSEDTRIEIIRTFTQSENGDFRIYPGSPGSPGSRAVGNSLLASDPSVISSRYDTSLNGGSFVANNFNLVQVSTWGLSAPVSTTLLGSPANLYTLQAPPVGDAQGMQLSTYAANVGDTFTQTVVLQGTNSSSSASLGFLGYVDGWSGNGDGWWAYGTDYSGAARILSGPGAIVQSPYGYWIVTGLSSSIPTRVEVSRTFTKTEIGDFRVYPDGPEGARVGAQFIVGSPSLSRTPGDITSFKHDSLGRLKIKVDSLGFKTYYLYDKRGRKTAEVGANGELVEYRYDAANRVVATIRYYYAPAAARLATLADPNNTLTIDNLRTSADSGVWLWNVYDKAGRLVEEITGDGRVTTFAYDGANKLIQTRKYVNLVSVGAFMTIAPQSVVLPPAHGGDAVTRLFYDKDGLAIGALNAEGYLTESVYGKAGQRIEEIVYAQQTSSSYWANGTLDQLRSTAAPVSGANRKTRYVYDARGLQSYAVNAQGIVTKFGYDAAGRVTETRIFATPISTSNYSHANVTALVNSVANSAIDRLAITTYDSRGQVASTTDATGLVTTFTYDASGNVIKAVVGSGGSARVTRNWYTQKGELRFTVDAEGYVTEYVYDALGQLLNTTRYDSATNVADGASAWAVASAISGDYAASRYQRTRATYDAFGKVLETYDADNIRTNVWYRGNGEASYVSVANGTVDQSDAEYFGYNHSGQVTWKGEAWGETAGRGDEQRATSYGYDGLGNLTSVVDPRGVTTTYSYDKLGRVTSVTDAAGGVTLYQYDAFGNQTAARDARGYWSYSYYDT